MFKNNAKAASKATKPATAKEDDVKPTHSIDETSAPRPTGIEPPPVVVVATGTDTQAPVLDFEPYQNSPYDSGGYSSSLMAKSNELAGSIWKGKEGYMRAKGLHPFDFDPASEREDFRPEPSETVVKNGAMFNYYQIRSKIQQALDMTLTLGFGNPGAFFGQRTLMVDTIKKLARLEKKHDEEEIFNEETRERIIDAALLPSAPASMGWMSTYVDLRYPPQKAVAANLLTNEEVQAIESLLNYLPRIRRMLTAYNSEPMVLKKEELLEPLLGDPSLKSSMFAPPVEKDKKFLKQLRDLHYFFNMVIPYNIKEDHIRAISYPLVSNDRWQELQKRSKELREASLGYVREEKPLSEVLQAIWDFSAALEIHFDSLAMEVNACFDYLNKIDLAFETLVTESEEKLRAGDPPF